ISNGGGERPMWAPNGREIFYLDANGFLTSVPVETSPALRPLRPKKLFKTKYFNFASGMNGRTYDVTRDGQRFLMIKELSAGPTPPALNVVVMLNLAEALDARLGPAK